ncbi:MAG: FecR domain-containing protein [Cyclobacteriaceae bacterium]|nr:FecR domain-containing protein [Cyclobacteriaceae bacterium]
MVTKSNPSGQKSRIQLPDGSVVHLNAESELTYIEGFSNDQRKIHLKGEAYFEVAKDMSRPFTVITDHISVTALGTEFNVNAFNTDIQVALIEVSVLVNNVANSDQLILKASEVLKFDSKAKLLKRVASNANDLSIWRDRIIYFENTPIEEAVNILSRWYAVDINIEGVSNKKLTCSGKFNNSSLELLLENLSYALDFQYEIKGKNVSLNFNN